MKQLYLFIVIALSIFNSISVWANETIITQTLIVEKNQKLEMTLKNRDPIETINFLHSNISENATFNIQVNNSSTSILNSNKKISMNKKDYINSFISGMHYVDKYNVKVDTKNIKISDNKKTATVVEVMTEEGVILNAKNLNNSGMPFLSKTTCTTTYKLNYGQIQSDHAVCKTQTGKIDSI